MNIKDGLVSVIGSVSGIVLSVVSTTEWLDLIARVISIIVSLATLGFLLWRWWKNASADGKITKEEIDEALQITKEAKDEIDTLSKAKDKKENNNEDEK